MEPSSAALLQPRPEPLGPCLCTWQLCNEAQARTWWCALPGSGSTRTLNTRGTVLYLI